MIKLTWWLGVLLAVAISVSVMGPSLAQQENSSDAESPAQANPEPSNPAADQDESEKSSEQDGFVPTETINVDSEISFPVDI